MTLKFDVLLGAGFHTSFKSGWMLNFWEINVASILYGNEFRGEYDFKG